MLGARGIVLENFCGAFWEIFQRAWTSLKFAKLLHDVCRPPLIRPIDVHEAQILLSLCKFSSSKVKPRISSCLRTTNR